MENRQPRPSAMPVLNRVLRYMLRAYWPLFLLVILCILVSAVATVTAATFQELDKKYVNVVLLSLIPILFQYLQTQISSAVQAAGATVEGLTAAQFAEYSVPIQEIQFLGNGAFLSSLLLAGLLAYVVDKKYFFAAAFAGALAFSSFIGMIHASTVALFPAESLPFGVIFLLTALWLVGKGLLFRQKGKPEAALPPQP